MQPPPACAANAPCLVGHWEIVRGRHDGRYQGGSARSFRRGDSLAITVAGRAIRVYGVTGPAGGIAVVMFAHLPPVAVDFYSAAVRTHALLYTSPEVPPGTRVATFIVAGRHSARSHGDFVNIDEIESLDRR
jgi:hypothetical protein